MPEMYIINYFPYDIYWQKKIIQVNSKYMTNKMGHMSILGYAKAVMQKSGLGSYVNLINILEVKKSARVIKQDSTYDVPPPILTHTKDRHLYLLMIIYHFHSTLKNVPISMNHNNTIHPLLNMKVQAIARRKISTPINQRSSNLETTPLIQGHTYQNLANQPQNISSCVR